MLDRVDLHVITISAKKYEFFEENCEILKKDTIFMICRPNISNKF